MSFRKVVPIRPPSQAGAGKNPPSRAEVEALILKARELAGQAPQKAAMILTGWMKDAQKNTQKNTKKKAG